MRNHLSTRDLAIRWGCSAGTLANKRCNGTGPNFMRLGGRVAYRLDDIEAFERGALVETGEGAA